MNVIIAPDKFKESLTSFDVCRHIAEGVNWADATADVLSFPLSDSGDGFAPVLQHYLQTETITCTVTDPLSKKIQATYQWNDQRQDGYN